MVRYALLGYGKVAHLHAQALKSVKDAQLVAVWGRNMEKARQFAQKWKIKAYTDLDQMVKEAKVDAVVVTTVHPLHMEHTLQALDAGLHVMVEKPMALTVRQCDLMIEKAEEKHKKLGVISQRRWYPACQRIRKAIDSGNLGTPVVRQVTMLGWRDKAYYDSDPWRGSWELEGGGVLINQAPTSWIFFVGISGRSQESTPSGTTSLHPYIEVEDSCRWRRSASKRCDRLDPRLQLAKGGDLRQGPRPRLQRVLSRRPDGRWGDVRGGTEHNHRPGGKRPVDYRRRTGNLERWKEEDAKLFRKVDSTTYFFPCSLRTSPKRSGRQGSRFLGI